MITMSTNLIDPTMIAVPRAGIHTSHTTPTATSAATTSRLPIRHIGALEVPAAGAWPLLRSSSVRRSVGRAAATEQPPVIAGWLDLNDDPTDCWLRIETEHLMVDLASATIGPDPFELSAWTFRGNGQIGAERGAAELHLAYHGVFRRGERMWAWFTGTGDIDVPAASTRRRFGRSRHSNAIAFDLVFGSTR
jgi:hypothetical protein